MIVGGKRWTGIKFKTGDTVKMRVDEARCAIYFAVNNGQFRELAKVEKRPSPYYLAVGASWEGTKFAIEHYSRRDTKAVDETKEAEHEVINIHFLRSVFHEMESGHCQYIFIRNTYSLDFTLFSIGNIRHFLFCPFRLSLPKEREIGALKTKNRRLKVTAKQAANQNLEYRVETESTRYKLSFSFNMHRIMAICLFRCLCTLFVIVPHQQQMNMLGGKLVSMQQETARYQKMEKERNAEVQALREEVKQFKQTNHELVVENLSLREQLLKVKDEEKEREEEVEELRKEVKLLKMQHLDESKYLQWGPDEITAWIINLDLKRLLKYEEALRKGLVQEQATGGILAEIDGGDLTLWGIGDRKDRKWIMGEIERLLANNAPNQIPQGVMVEGANAAPSAFV